MNFREHLSWLKEHQQLLEINDPVDPDLEAAEIVRQLSQHSPCSVLFNNLRNNQYAVIANLFYEQDSLEAFYGDQGAMTDVLGRIPVEVPGRISLSHWLETQPFYCLDRLLHPFDEVSVKSETLPTLPMLQYWPEDSGPYFSLSLTVVRDLHGMIHCGIYRLERHDDDRLTLHCLPGSHTKRIYEEYRRVGKKMPIVVVSGVDPALMVAAMLPLGREIDTIAFASWLQGQAIPCSASPVYGLPVPCPWEICLEGAVDGQESCLDGPHGNFRGAYSSAVPCPVIHVKKAWAKTDAICPITVVGPPPTESYTLARARLPYAKWVLMREFPWVADVKWIDYGEYHNNFIIQVVDALTQDRREALLDHYLVKNAQLILFVDSNTSINNTEYLLWRCFNLPWQEAVSWRQDTLIIDATRCYGTKQLKMDHALCQKVQQRLKHWLETDRGEAP